MDTPHHLSAMSIGSIHSQYSTDPRKTAYIAAPKTTRDTDRIASQRASRPPLCTERVTRHHHFPPRNLSRVAPVFWFEAQYHRLCWRTSDGRRDRVGSKTSLTVATVIDFETRGVLDCQIKKGKN